METETFIRALSFVTAGLLVTFLIGMLVWLMVRIGSVAYFKSREQHIKRVLDLSQKSKELENTDG